MASLYSGVKLRRTGFLRCGRPSGATPSSTCQVWLDETSPLECDPMVRPSLALPLRRWIVEMSHGSRGGRGPERARGRDALGKVSPPRSRVRPSRIADYRTRRL